eukprot:GHRR01002740.1.p1 GENE.GHRR01002740.1~~GHRR01002740.1.p1  ORF type:complete len:388 (+),score=116.25 GHRR01002740.1:178-1341(+)
MVTRLVVAVDGSEHGTNALRWAAKQLWRDNVQLDIVTVLPPVAMNVYPVAPVATAAAVAAVTHQWEAQKQQNELHATQILKEAVQQTMEAGVSKDCLHAHALPAAGGASGVGDSIVEFVKAKGADLVVVGSRGLGSIKRSLMSFVGLGCVSDYVMHQLHVPVVVVHSTRDIPPAGHTENSKAGPRKLCIPIDDSVHSQYALTWLQQHMLQNGDQVHVIVVALPVPYPILDEAVAAVAVLEAQQWRTSTEKSLEYAQSLAAKAAATLSAAASAAGINDVSTTSCALTPEGGASDVGASVCEYANNCKVDLLVLGSRGMGSFKRSLMSFVGLGSVSDYCVHNAACPVAVVKADPDKLPAATAYGVDEQAAAAAAQMSGGGADAVGQVAL